MKVKKAVAGLLSIILLTECALCSGSIAYAGTELAVYSDGFEEQALNENLHYYGDYTEVGEPVYGVTGKWSTNMVAGYLARDEKGDLYRTTYSATVYGSDGTPYTQTAVKGATGSSGSIAVTDQTAHSGKQSLTITPSGRVLSMPLSVKGGTDYKLTFYAFNNNVQGSGSNQYFGATVMTTLNIGNLGTLKGDGSTVVSGGGCAISDVTGIGAGYVAGSNVFCLAHSGKRLYNASTEWEKIELNFTTSETETYTTVYLSLYAPAGTYYIDDLSLVDTRAGFGSLPVDLVDMNGQVIADSNAYVQASYTIGADGGATLNVDYDRTGGAYQFLGWYDENGDLKYCEETVLAVPVSEAVKYTARIQSVNLIPTASFEKYENGTSLVVSSVNDFPTDETWGAQWNNGYYKRTHAGTVYDKDGRTYTQIDAEGMYAPATPDQNYAKVSNRYAKSGTNSLYLNMGSFPCAVTKIRVEKNTDYVLSYYWFAPAGKSIGASAVTTTVNVGDISAVDGVNSPLMDSLIRFAIDSKYFAASAVSTGGWQKMHHSFNSGNFEELYLVIQPSVNCSYQNSTGKTEFPYISDIWVDDFSLIEAKPATVTVEDIKNCAYVNFTENNAQGAVAGSVISFTVIDTVDTAPTVKVNGKEIACDTDGVYSFTATENNDISVRYASDEALPYANKDEQGRDLSAYNADVYAESIWSGDTVYQESALFTKEKDTVQLLYPVDEIISFRSYDLKTYYLRGVDFEITAEGRLKRTADSRIPVWQGPLITTKNTGWATNDGQYIGLTDDKDYPKFAVSVTYRHTKTFDDGFMPCVPASQQTALKNTIKKLEEGKDVNVLIFGDSISCGWSSSGLNSTNEIYDVTNTEGNFKPYIIHVAPYAPTWIDMLYARLKQMYPKANISFKNLSLGGMTSKWGNENIQERLALWKDADGSRQVPDLMLLGFGVNDSAANISATDFQANIQQIISQVRTFSANPDLNVLMYSPMLPNQQAVSWPVGTFLAYEKAMKQLAEKDEKIGLVPLTSIFQEVAKSKSSEDYLNTNLNHGNDFTARIYLTGILAAMTKESELPDGAALFTNIGVSIRKENEVFGKPQALRYKINLEKKALNTDYSGYSLVEYGAIIAKTDDVGLALDMDDVTAHRAIKGVAYSVRDGINILYAQNETFNTYTMALYNIGVKRENGMIVETDYTCWATDYSVRAYAVFRAVGKPDYVVYAPAAQNASVFAVMQSIENGTNADDQAYLNEKLLLNNQILAAYNDWKNREAH